MISFRFVADEGAGLILAPHAGAGGDCPCICSGKSSCVPCCQDGQESS